MLDTWPADCTLQHNLQVLLFAVDACALKIMHGMQVTQLSVYQLSRRYIPELDLTSTVSWAEYFCMCFSVAGLMMSTVIAVCSLGKLPVYCTHTDTAQQG